MIKRKYNIVYIFNLNIFYNANSIVFEKTDLITSMLFEDG